MDTIKRVQDLMQERDMNLCVLAKKCGISYSTIQTTARRGGQLSVETIERICLGLGISLKDFFDVSYLLFFCNYAERTHCLGKQEHHVHNRVKLKLSIAIFFIRKYT